MSATRALVIARVAAVVGLLALVQVAFVSQLRMGGVAPDLLLGVAVATAVVAGPDRGAIVGFAAGLAYDLFLDTPFGLSALTYSVVAYGTGLFQLPLAAHPRWWRVGSVAAASAVGVTLWASLGVVLGQEYLLGMPVPRVAITLGLLNGLLAVPVLAVSRWLFAPLTPERIPA